MKVVSSSETINVLLVQQALVLLLRSRGEIMNLLDEIRQSGKKSKELTTFTAELIKEKKPSSKEFVAALTLGSNSERGTCVEALEYLTQDTPEIAKPYLSQVIGSLTDKAPRVKWEAARVIGNIAAKYPQEALKAIDNLLVNTNDKGTVVRWSTAFALGEILKHNATIRPKLQKRVEEIVERETNNGVKNVYLKALKSLGK
jgi:HEAT repeat protein